MENSNIDLQVQVLLAEYERTQEDIRHHKTTLQTIVNFMILMMIAQIAALPFIGQLSGAATVLLLIFALPFTLLAIYHSAYIARIHAVALYVDNNLRKRINDKVGHETLGLYDWKATKRPWQLRHSTPDGRHTYIAILGLKLLPQMTSVVAFVVVNAGDWTWWEFPIVAIMTLIALWSSVRQND